MKTKLLLLVSILVMSGAVFAAEQIIPTDASDNRQWQQTHYRTEGNSPYPLMLQVIVCGIKRIIAAKEIKLFPRIPQEIENDNKPII
jgi:hypothetical protein